MRGTALASNAARCQKIALFLSIVLFLCVFARESSLAFANASPPGGLRTPGPPVPCFAPRPGRGDGAPGDASNRSPRLTEAWRVPWRRDARLPALQPCNQQKWTPVLRPVAWPFSAAIFRLRATLFKPVAEFDQPAPGGGFLVTPGWSPGTPGDAVASRASREPHLAPLSRRLMSAHLVEPGVRIIIQNSGAGITFRDFSHSAIFARADQVTLASGAFFIRPDR